MYRSLRARITIAGLLLVAASTAAASMGNTATTYGLLPEDMATAQAMSMFNTQVSTTYYNPAYLVKDKHGELSAGIFHAENRLRATSEGGSNPPTRNGNLLQNTPSQQVLIGMKTDLTGLTKLKKPLYFGFIAGLEKFGTEMLSFDSQTSKKGQYFRFGRQPLFLNMGVGTNVFRGIDFGFSTRVTLHSTADLKAQTDLSGNTQYEKLSVSAQPSLRAIVSLNMDWHDVFCGHQSCWFDGLETAFAWRQHSNTKTTVNANTTIPGTIPPPGLTLAISTLDSYQPDILALGFLYHGKKWRAGLTVEQQRWSSLNQEFRKDTIKDQANWDFKDVIVPRLGGEYSFSKHYTLMTGVAWERSPMNNTRSLDVNYLDTDQVIAGVGISAHFKDPWLLAYPVRLDLGYQYHYLMDRNFQMTYSNAPSNPYETVKANGSVQVIAGSITMKF